MSDRFEIEAEMTIHTLELRLPFAEVPVAFFDRVGGESKLSTFTDGRRIAWLMAKLYRDQQPMRFFLFWRGCHWCLKFNCRFFL